MKIFKPTLKHAGLTMWMTIWAAVKPIMRGHIIYQILQWKSYNDRHLFLHNELTKLYETLTFSPSQRAGDMTDGVTRWGNY
ncbi:hypothetical protein XELAEV_18002288mg [Xenopus laevis]|nr:hypothetical protein XELAEV_18002288mg [Xenopus laevis]